MQKVSEQFKRLIVAIHKATDNNLMITVKIAKVLRPQTHASSVKCWIDPSYAKVKNEQSKKATQKWKHIKPESHDAMVQRRLEKFKQQYHSDEEFRKKHLESKKQWHESNKDVVSNYLERTKDTRRERNRKYENKRLKEDHNFKLLHNMRSFVRNKLKRQFKRTNSNFLKESSTVELIGCSTQHLADHLRAQYKPGMTDENYGQWHIDHIKPCAAFNLVDNEQAKLCFHYTNLQPLWAAENLAKGSKYDN